MLRAVSTQNAAGLTGDNANPTLSAPSIRWIGDSICSQNDQSSPATSGGTTSTISRYPYGISQVHWLTGNALNYVATASYANGFRYGSNSGIGGDDFDELQARLPAILATMPEKYLFFYSIGTNQINLGTSLADCITKATLLIQTTIASGKVPIMATVLSRNSTDGSNDWSNTVTTAAQKRLILAGYNSWLLQYCKENNIICVDLHAVFTNASGNAITGYTVDSVHPSSRGSWYLAQEILRSLGPLLPNCRTGQRHVGNTYDATYNPYGNPLNGALTGTGGTTADAGGTGTVGGTIPDSWRLNKATSTTTSCVAAIVARTDGRPGNVLELTFTSLGTGSASENWRFEYYSGGSTSFGSYGVAGDLLQMEAEIEIVGGHGGIILWPNMRIGNSLPVTRTATTISFDAATKQILDSGSGFGSFLAGRRIVVSGATNAGNNSAFLVTSAAAGVLQLSDDAVLTTEAAGASVTVTIPAGIANTGASTSTAPDVDTPIIYQQSDILQLPYTSNIIARVDFNVNGTIAGTGVVRMALPEVRKLPLTPSLLTYLAHDD